MSLRDDLPKAERVVACTGHRHLYHRDDVRAFLRETLEQLVEEHGDGLVAVSGCEPTGADQLWAEEAIGVGARLWAAVPHHPGYRDRYCLGDELLDRYDRVTTAAEVTLVYAPPLSEFDPTNHNMGRNGLMLDVAPERGR